MMKPLSISDYERAAQERVDASIWDYYQGGSDDEVTLRANRQVFERVLLRPRVLVDVSAIDLSISVQGTPLTVPIMVAPMAYHGLGHAGGECATAQGVGNVGIVMIASTASSRPLEEIAQSASGPLWFQLYVRTYEDARELVGRAEVAGYRAIVLTVDTPRLGNRERDRRHDSAWSGIRSANYRGPASSYVGDALTWKFLSWLRTFTSLPIILKGLLTSEDAVQAVNHGINGIIVSNHGGRQLDGVIPALAALPEVVEAINGQCEVYFDSGIRRGTDILKALALGARAVCIGRPVLWGLIVNGSTGVTHVLDILRDELALAMALAGRPNIKSIDRSLVKCPF